MSETAAGIPEAALVSYCVVCDARLGECEHGGPRYLEPPRYELIEGDSSQAFVWRVGALDSARMQSGSGYNGRPAAPTATPIPVADLCELIERRAYMSESLDALLASSYERNALQTSRAVESAAQAFDAGRIQSFGGVVVKRLKEIIGRR